jgi:glycosyltransferase involved in cell wall biosynthesis
MLVEAQSGLADGMERRMEAATLAAAGGISSPSRALADYIAQSCGIEPQRIVRIPYPIDTTKFASDLRTPKELMVLFVGRVERRKGAQWLLHALPEVSVAIPVSASPSWEDKR